MKVLILFGSPHENGYTSLLLNHFLEFLPSCEIVKIDAYKENVAPCIDCGKCKKIGKCVFSDMNKINEYIDSSDFIIIASPIYNASFPAPLKSIFDRFQPYYFSRYISKPKKKKVLTLFTQGTEKTDYEKIIFPQIFPIIKIIGGEICGNLILKGTDNKKLDIDKCYIKSENIIKVIINNLNSIS